MPYENPKIFRTSTLICVFSPEEVRGGVARAVGLLGLTVKSAMTPMRIAIHVNVRIPIHVQEENCGQYAQKILPLMMNSSASITRSHSQ